MEGIPTALAVTITPPLSDFLFFLQDPCSQFFFFTITIQAWRVFVPNVPKCHCSFQSNLMITSSIVYIVHQWSHLDILTLTLVLFCVTVCMNVWSYECVWAAVNQQMELQGCRTLQGWSDQLPLFGLTDCSDPLPFICRSSRGEPHTLSTIRVCLMNINDRILWWYYVWCMVRIIMVTGYINCNVNALWCSLHEVMGYKL